MSSQKNPATMETTARVLEMLLTSLRARASYQTRVWTTLLIPQLAGTVLDWPTRTKMETFGISVLAVVVLTVTQWLWKKHLR